MAKMKRMGWRLCLTDDEGGDAAQLFDYQDVYGNLTQIPLLTDDGRSTIVEELLSQLESLPSDASDIPGEEIGYIMYITRLFQACMERNQPLNILLDGSLTLESSADRILHFFEREYQLWIWEKESGARPAEGECSIAILDGSNYREGRTERFASVLRLMRRYGRVIMVSQEGTLDKSVEMCLNMGSHETFGGVGVWTLRVTGALHRWAGCAEGNKAGDVTGAEETGEREITEQLPGLWDQVRKPLYEMAEMEYRDTEAEEWEQVLLGCIAALHAIEDVIISLYSRLDNLDLKVMANWAKAAVMDLYTEIHMGRNNVRYFQDRMRKRLIDFSEAFGEEFSKF